MAICPDKSRAMEGDGTATKNYSTAAHLLQIAQRDRYW